MRIAQVQDFHADGGWQTLSFLKVTADDGSVGWSEFNEGFSGAGLRDVVRRLGAAVLGLDPRRTLALSALLQARTRPAAGGLNAQAAAAIENACLDLKARALGVPVCELFGGPLREQLPAYWSHCGMYRLRRPDLFAGRGLVVPRGRDDLPALAREVAAGGWRALKTNLLRFGLDGAAEVLMPGFGRGAGHPARNLDGDLVDDARALLQGLQSGAPGLQVMLDLNFNFRPEGARRLAAALAPLQPGWIEFDCPDPAALAFVRAHSPVPIASLEAVYGCQAMRPFLEARAVDVAIIDPMWNGFGEALRMAALADSHEVNVASHVYSGHLATAMAAHFCALVPNLRLMEAEGDRVPWLDALYDRPLVVDQGAVRLPEGPGWGIAVDEAALLRHPAVAG